MQKYMIKASYSTQGIKGVQKDGGTGRADSVGKAIAGVGGQMESFYFAFGSDDVYIVAELPDNESAMALAATVGASGALSSYETVVLCTPDQVDRAVGKTVDYRAPGA
ncbi:MAG: GYD domain-containing protein [Candidatus Nanopelagicales bacterium]